MDAISNSRKLLSTRAASVFLGLSASSLEKLRHYGGGPRFVKYGRGRGGRVVYDERDLEAWTESRKRSCTGSSCMAA